jgi:XTP/dITP diphosphohydrolase
MLASGNAHKLKELQRHFSSFSKEFSLTLAPSTVEVEENGKTYYENSHLKAAQYYKQYKRPVLADDSGLNVSFLPDKLGVHSARFGGGELTDREKNELLLTKLTSSTEREASFICILCFYLTPQEIFFFEGQLKGLIAHQIQGEGGFGYDPIFIPEELNREKIKQGQQELTTLAMAQDWKMKNSHRARACKKALEFFSQRF